MVRRSLEGSDAGDDSIDLPTREGQHIRQDISVTYNTSEEKAAQVFKSFRGADISEIENTFIRRTIITVAQNAAGQMLLTEIISSKRGELQNLIQKELEAELGKIGFNMDKVNFGASQLPPAIEAQMQQKMGAQQQAQQAEYELQRQETLAKAAVAQAQGQAQSVLVRAKAESEANRLLQTSLSQTLVNYRSVEKWNGVLPQVTSGNTPFIDLRRP
jgi:regulator of protease activity HflC (stomatin/prohibitin superfamily)